MKSCAVEGCEKPHRARGYCKNHYHSEYFRKRTCVEPDCNSKICAAERCFPHYSALRAAGADPCDVEGCDRPQVTRGWCEMHYHRFMTTGSVGDPQPSRTPLKGSTCSGPDCDRDAKARGYCASHYSQFKTGKPLAPIRRVRASTRGKTLAERIEHYSAPPNENGCRLWTGHTSGRPGKEYAMLSVGKKSERAHRVAFEVFSGEKLRPFEPVHHSCGVNSCVAGEHLERATTAENTLEMLGRTAFEREVTHLREENAALRNRVAELELLLPGVATISA